MEMWGFLVLVVGYTILEFFNDGPVADDRANLQIEFKNNGKPKPPRYI